MKLCPYFLHFSSNLYKVLYNTGPQKVLSNNGCSENRRSESRTSSRAVIEFLICTCLICRLIWVKFVMTDLNVLLLCIFFFVKIGTGKVILLLRAKLNYIYARTVKRRDVWRIKNSSVKFVHCVTDCTICNIVKSAYGLWNQSAFILCPSYNVLNINTEQSVSETGYFSVLGCKLVSWASSIYSQSLGSIWQPQLAWY